MIKKKPQTRSRQRVSGSKVPMTYYRSSSGKADEKDSPFTRAKAPGKLKKVLLGTVDLIVIALLIIGFFYSLLVSPNPSISASSYIYRSTEVYRQAAEEELRSFSSRNKLSINETQIINKLQAEFPEIASGSIELPIISQTPKIHLSISEPAFVLISGSESYIVAVSGVVIGHTRDFTAIRKLPEVEDQSGFKLKIGSPAFSSASAKFIEATWKNIQEAGVSVTSMVLPPLPMELNLRTADKPYFVKFDMGGDSALQSGQFLAARAQFAKDGTTPLQYLDVRVKGKIFYK